MSVSEFTKKYVRNRADYLCEYCHSPEKISSSRFTIDHLQPRSLGGLDTEENLALACNRCNQTRYFTIVGIFVNTPRRRNLLNNSGV
jgi:5-methylcytosine-specific restriction endonuclease McrA